MKLIPLMTASLALSLAACGGGGSSGSSNNNSSSAVSSSVASSVVSSTPSSAAVSSSSSSAVVSSASSASSISSEEASSSSSSSSALSSSSESSVAQSSASSVSSLEVSSSSVASSQASSSVESSAASSESSAGESSSSDASAAGMWNIYNGNFHPITNGSITLATGSPAEFTAGGTGDYFVDQLNGSVSLDTSAATANTTSATFFDVVNNSAEYPKYLTLVAGIAGNADNLRVMELEVAMADQAQAGSRLKAILRNDGSNKGVQLEQANGGSTVNSFGITDMDQFAIYQIAITLNNATTGSVRVYRNGALMPNLSLNNVTMRATSSAGDNFVRFGEVSGSTAYKSTIDWLVWTNTGAFSPDDLSGELPEGLGCVYGYGSSDNTATCANPPASSSSSSSGGASSSAASSVDYGSSDIRPAKMEGFADYAGVTGGAAGNVVYVSTGTQLNAALCTGRATKTTPIIIMVDGTISHANTTAQGCNTQADVIEIKQMSNVSIIGVGSNALFEEIGIHLRDASNIIIQNVHIRNVKKSGSPTSNGGDAIGMESGVNKVWIDHNWLEASGGEKDGYDSLLDMKAGVTNVTVSYNLFNDSSRGGLIGSSDSDDENTNITFHHNWYKNIQQRTPLIRHALVHTYNNFWQNDDINTMIHGINSRMNAKVLVESNYFHNTNNPLLASDDSSTPGCWQTNNDNTVAPSIYYSRTVGNGALVIPEMVNGQLQSTCVVTVPYTVDMDPAANVPAIVMANAGVGKIGTASSSSSSSSSSQASSSSSANSSAAGSSSSAASGALLSENFNVDKATLFSAAYQAVSTDANEPLYYVTGGNSGITIANNELTIAAARFTIGHRPPRAATTSGDTSANGDFNLSNPYRITFKVVTSSGTGKVQVYVDNNTTGSANSMHGGSSRVFDAAANTLTAGQIVEITPAIGTSTSFIALRTESGTSVTIDDLTLEYIE